MSRHPASFGARYPAWLKMFQTRLRAAEAAGDWQLQVALMQELQEKQQPWFRGQRAMLARQETL